MWGMGEVDVEEAQNNTAAHSTAGSHRNHGVAGQSAFGVICRLSSIIHPGICIYGNPIRGTGAGNPW